MDMENLISNSLNELCIEYLALKRSYFTTKGKMGWNPLKPDTVRKKKVIAPDNATKFNIQSGKLRDSISVTWSWTETGITITVEVKEDQFLDYLTKYLGRDFFTIDKEEVAFLIDRFKKLMIKNATRS